MPRVSLMTNNSTSAKLEGFGNQLTHHLPLRDQCLWNYSMNIPGPVSHSPTWKPWLTAGNQVEVKSWFPLLILITTHCVCIMYCRETLKHELRRGNLTCPHESLSLIAKNTKMENASTEFFIIYWLIICLFFFFPLSLQCTLLITSLEIILLYHSPECCHLWERMWRYDGVWAW